MDANIKKAILIQEYFENREYHNIVELFNNCNFFCKIRLLNKNINFERIFLSYLYLDKIEYYCAMYYVKYYSRRASVTETYKEISYLFFAHILNHKKLDFILAFINVKPDVFSLQEVNKMNFLLKDLEDKAVDRYNTFALFYILIWILVWFFRKQLLYATLTNLMVLGVAFILFISYILREVKMRREMISKGRYLLIRRFNFKMLIYSIQYKLINFY